MFHSRIIDLKHQQHIDSKNIAVERAAQAKEDKMKQLKSMNSKKEEQFRNRMKMILQNELK